MRGLIGAAVVAWGLAGLAAPAMAAQTEQSKACSREATSEGLHGKERATFRAQCMKASAPGREGAVSPGGGRAEAGHMKACGAEWKAAKAANRTPAGETWPHYWSGCNKRMKGAG